MVSLALFFLFKQNNCMKKELYLGILFLITCMLTTDCMNIEKQRNFDMIQVVYNLSNSRLTLNLLAIYPISWFKTMRNVPSLYKISFEYKTHPYKENT